MRRSRVRFPSAAFFFCPFYGLWRLSLIWRQPPFLWFDAFWCIYCKQFIKGTRYCLDCFIKCMGINIHRSGCFGVSKKAGYRLYIHMICNQKRCCCMSKTMERDIRMKRCVSTMPDWNSWKREKRRRIGRKEHRDWSISEQKWKAFLGQRLKTRICQNSILRLCSMYCLQSRMPASRYQRKSPALLHNHPLRQASEALQAWSAVQAGRSIHLELMWST